MVPSIVLLDSIALKQGAGAIKLHIIPLKQGAGAVVLHQGHRTVGNLANSLSVFSFFF